MSRDDQRELLDLPLMGGEEEDRAPGAADLELGPRAHREEAEPEPRRRRATRRPERSRAVRSPKSAGRSGLGWLAGSLLTVLALAVGGLLGLVLKPLPPIAEASRPLLDFGEGRLAAESEAQAVELINVGQRALRVTSVGIDGDAFTLTADDCTGRLLAADERCAVAVSFTPSGLGAHQATLRLTGETANPPRQVMLLGRGIAPALDAEPRRLDFGEHVVGSASRRSRLFFINSGSAALRVRSVALGGRGAGDFITSSDRCSGRTLEPGGRCAVDFAFLPTTAGERRATVRLGSDGETAFNPELYGVGLAQQPLLTLKPQSLTFWPLRVGNAADPLRLTLTNEGTGPLRLDEVSLSPGGEAAERSFELSGECVTLQPAARCDLEVSFRPAAEGPLTAEIEVRHGGESRRVPITGEGTLPKIFLDPLALTFRGVEIGRTSDSKFIRVINNGSGALEITDIRATGSGAQAFTVRPVGCTVKPLEPRRSCGVEVRFTPRRPGDYDAELLLEHDAEGSPHRVALRGRSDS